MRLRKRYLPLAAVLGAAIAIVPAMGGFASSPTINAEESGGYYGKRYWSPTTAEVATGGSVTFQNMSMSVRHGLVWHSLPAGASAPSCESAVPVEASVDYQGQTNWKGSCTFNTAGTYTVYCSVHGSEMTATITVGGTSSSSSSSKSSSSSSSSSSYSSSSSSSSSTYSTSTGYTSPNTTVSYSSSSTRPGYTSSGSTKNSSSSSEEGESQPPSGHLVLASSQTGSSVRGSLTVSKAGKGGRLQVELLATSASLAKAKKHKHASRVSVGRFVRSGLRAGKVSFSVALSSKARSAVRRHHHLALTVKITVTPTHGKAQVMSRSVTVHG